jgi:hypothetical protein
MRFGGIISCTSFIEYTFIFRFHLFTKNDLIP